MYYDWFLECAHTPRKRYRRFLQCLLYPNRARVPFDVNWTFCEAMGLSFLRRYTFILWKPSGSNGESDVGLLSMATTRRGLFSWGQMEMISERIKIKIPATSQRSVIRSGWSRNNGIGFMNGRDSSPYWSLRMMTCMTNSITNIVRSCHKMQWFQKGVPHQERTCMRSYIFQWSCKGL